jgi:hypothetical protein
VIETDESHVNGSRFSEDEFHSPITNFCQQAENDRKEVAAAITPLWVIRGDNIGVAGVRWVE